MLPPRASVVDDPDPTVRKAQGDELLLDRPGDAMPDALTAVRVGLREAPDLRAAGPRIARGVAMDGDQVGVARVGEIVRPLLEGDRPVGVSRESRLESGWVSRIAIRARLIPRVTSASRSPVAASTAPGSSPPWPGSITSRSFAPAVIRAPSRCSWIDEPWRSPDPKRF